MNLWLPVFIANATGILETGQLSHNVLKAAR
jgi:hypothetical protein